MKEQERNPVLIEDELVRERIRAFITMALIRDPDYPLADDEPLISGALIDLAALEDLALFIEEDIGVHLDEDELTNENIDTLDDLVAFTQSRMA